MCSPPTCKNGREAKWYLVGGILGCLFPFGIGAMVAGCCGAGTGYIIIGILQLITSCVGVGIVWSFVFSVLMIIEGISYQDATRADIHNLQQQHAHPFIGQPQNYGGVAGGAPQAQYVVQGGGHQPSSPGWHPAVGVAPYGNYAPTAAGGTALTVNAPPAGHGYPPTAMSQHQGVVGYPSLQQAAQSYPSAPSPKDVYQTNGAAHPYGPV